MAMSTPTYRATKPPILHLAETGQMMGGHLLGDDVMTMMIVIRVDGTVDPEKEMVIETEIGTGIDYWITMTGVEVREHDPEVRGRSLNAVL